MAKEFSKFKVLEEHVQIRPETGIEVIEFAGTLVEEVQVPSRQP